MLLALTIGGLALLAGILGGYVAGRRGLSSAVGAAVEAERTRGESAVERERVRACSEVSAERLRADTAAAAAAAARTEVESLRTSLGERGAVLDEARANLAKEFQVMAREALAGNNQQFLDLAAATLETQREKATADLDSRRSDFERIVGPMRDTLARMDESVRSVEKSRREAHGELRNQLSTLGAAQQSLEAETRNLVSALRASGTRGKWGELQLRRVVEIAGMLAYCDFTEQASTDAAGDRRRPDLVVTLPGGAKVVVDSKAPMDAFLEAQDCADESGRGELLQRHAKAVRQHVTSLSAKRYWEQFESSPEFVVMFLPGEALFATALEADPTLIEVAAGANVVLATPSSLITMLKTIAYGWRQERIAENADEVRRLGVELHERLRTLAGHFEDLRKGLQKAVDSYNGTVGSFERRVLVAARKFGELGASNGDELPEVSTVEAQLRGVDAADVPNPEALVALPAGVTPLTR